MPMTRSQLVPSLSARWLGPSTVTLSSMIASIILGGCGQSSSMSTAPSPSGAMGSGLMVQAPSPDPRVGLRAGEMDAGQAIWNMKLVSATPPSERFKGVTSSDLAFTGNYVIQGNYNGYQVWDISNPAWPTLKTAYYCPASQSDVSVYKNILFVSAEAPSARLDCGGGGVPDSVSKDRLRGIRVFDATDMANPKYLTNVQTCRGSHTHTVLSDPKDKENVYIYVSGTSGVRSPNELAGCINANASDDPNTSLFRIEVIKVPVAHPERAAIAGYGRIFSDPKTGLASGLALPRGHGVSPADTGANARPRGGANVGAMAALRPLTATSTASDSTRFNKTADSLRAAGVLPPGTTNAQLSTMAAAGRARGGAAGGAPRPGAGFLTQCHDITVYPAIGLAGGACAGMGLLVDITNPVAPRRVGEVADSNFSFWHSATFSNDGSKVLFSDEWGGGGAAYCRANDPKEWGANAIFTIKDNKMVFQSYYKLPAAQTRFENCVSHNGSLIPIPGRDVMVQSWYQGGISVFDWTDPKRPTEIAFFDRGPNDSTRLAGGGQWSAYWYNGLIVGSEMQRGLDVLELTPSSALTQNEIDAAKTVRFEFFNAQDQQKFVWPASFALSRAYLDQLERTKGMSAGAISSARTALASAERASGTTRSNALSTLAAQIEKDAGSASDKWKAGMLATSVSDLRKSMR